MPTIKDAMDIISKLSVSEQEKICLYGKTTSTV